MSVSDSGLFQKIVQTWHGFQHSWMLLFYSDDDVLKTSISIFPAAPFSVLEFLDADRACTVKTTDFAFVKGQCALRVARIGCPTILQLVGEVQAALALP